MDFCVGPWLVRPEMDTVAREGESCHISPKAMEVLVCMARRQGRVVAKDEIFQEVWAGTFVSDDALTRCVGELRRSFHDDAREPSVIQTISKRGYLLLAPVTWNGSDGPPAAPSPGVAHSSFWKRRWAIPGIGLVVLTALLALMVRSPWRAQAPAAIRRIAVLPLTDLSGDPAQEYFADGMTEQLITELAQVSAWNVISRTSVMRYKRTKQPLRQVARELEADAVMEGTVLRSGSRVRITAQLIDARTDLHIWSGAFERDVSDVLPLQSGIARAIAGELKVTLSPRESVRLGRTRKMVPEAYEAYLRGWYFFDRAQYLKAASYFEQATIQDPGFALAHALLYEADGMWSYVQDLPLSDRARRAAERARELDDTLAEVHDASGDIKFYDHWDWQAGEAEFHRAVELDPGSIDAAWHYTLCLHALARWDAAEREMGRALHLDPVSPALNLHKLTLLVDTHRYESALQQFQKVIDLDPNSAGAYHQISQVYAALGKESDATAAFLKAATLSGTDAGQVNALEAAARTGGLRSCLRKRVEQLQVEAMSRRVSPLAFAGLYVRLGENGQAMEALETGYRQRGSHMPWIKSGATWDPLRSDPRFQSLLRRMRFPD